MQQWLKNYFELEALNTDIKTEVSAGLTVFITMAYILILNPMILAQTGMDFGAVFTATALTTIIATAGMSLIAKLPLALSSGMGLNTLFAYYAVLESGHSWSFALTATLIVGLLFLLLSPLNIREKVMQWMPVSLRHAITAGIGLFITSIGLKNSGLIIASDSTLIALGDLSAPAPLLACIGLAITAVLMVRKVPMALLLGIAITTIIGFFFGVTPKPTGIVSLPPSLAPTLLQFDFSRLFSLDMLMVVFTFGIVAMFNTAGLLIGFSHKLGANDPPGDFPAGKKALLCDAIGTTVGACLGTSSQTIFAESASGIAVGGRSGLTALVVAICFLFAIFFSPLIQIIPNSATGPALILVGLFMISSLLNIPFDDHSEGIPAFLTVIMMPFSASIADGIGWGMISYCLLKGLGGSERRKQLHPMIVVFALLFLLKYIIL